MERGGPYYGLDNIDPWDIDRNAMLCRNGYPAICHPPCKRWGRYWSGGPSAKEKMIMGDDGGCFAFSLWYVRTFGGVIEHPEASHAWNWFGLNKPRKKGGWMMADDFGGWTCCVEQGHYGHKARKATWLYLNKFDPPELIWGKSEGKMRMDPGYWTKEMAKGDRARPDYKPIKRLSEQERMWTPEPFRDLLIGMVTR